MPAMNAATIRREVAAAANADDEPRLVALAKRYTAYLSPMFHLIPWDETRVIGEVD